MTVGLLQRMLHEAPKLGRAERRVADVIHARPDEVVHMSIAVLSDLCGVSDPTVIRFCRRFGFEGYQDFKVNLAQSLVPSAPFHYEKITAQDSVESIVRKTCRNSLSAIQSALTDLIPVQIEDGARRIHRASWIGIYAAGMSEISALDCEHKFQRLGLRCAAVLGRGRQQMQSSSSRPGELAIFFSQSGATRNLVTIARTIREKNCPVLSIAPGGSPLAAVSDAVIEITPYERTELMTPLASRLNHHLVVNMLVTAVAILSGSEFPDQLAALDFWMTEKLNDGAGQGGVREG